MSIASIVLSSLLHFPPGIKPSGSSEPAWFPADELPAQRAYEATLNAFPQTEFLRRWHDQCCREPHPAGSDADRRMIAMLRDTFEDFGLDTEVHEFAALLSAPVRANLKVIRPDGMRVSLPIRERAVPQDPDSAHPALTDGWNAYSGSGRVVAPVVYVNYGTHEDFEQLDAMGISCRGRVVMARYGGNYRGYKVAFAEARGAAGVIMFTDPADAGRGPAYPDGGWANETSIQRGSIKTLPYPGDPRTPGVASTLDRAGVLDHHGLPRIPVQPIGWSAAAAILEQMDGLPAPEDWQGGLDVLYRTTSSRLLVDLDVEQRRAILPTANVIGMVRGTTWPDEYVVIGCHFDAWTFGAGDPHAGTIVLMEMARSFAAAAKHGQRPKRTVVFAHWGAEEFGIIGSTEWVERHREALTSRTVAYLNLDMAAMGPNFGSSAAPLLHSITTQTGRDIPALDGTDRSVYEQWTNGGEESPRFGRLGGGSDHIGFYLHAGIPSASLGARGASGVSYHTAYDSLTWYRMTVGKDYRPAKMLSRFGNTLVARLANAPIPPLDPRGYVDHLDDAIVGLIAAFDRAGDRDAAIDRLHEVRDLLTNEVSASFDELMSSLDDIDVIVADDEKREALSSLLLSIESAWLEDAGLPGRTWYRSRYASTDARSGYGALMLPAIVEAHRANDLEALRSAIDDVERRLHDIRRRVVTASRALAER